MIVIKVKTSKIAYLYEWSLVFVDSKFFKHDKTPIFLKFAKLLSSVIAFLKRRKIIIPMSVRLYILRTGDVYSIVTRGKWAIPHFYPTPFVGRNAHRLGPTQIMKRK